MGKIKQQRGYFTERLLKAMHVLLTSRTLKALFTPSERVACTQIDLLPPIIHFNHHCQVISIRHNSTPTTTPQKSLVTFGLGSSLNSLACHSRPEKVWVEPFQLVFISHYLIKIIQTLKSHIFGFELCFTLGKQYPASLMCLSMKER